MVSQVSSRIQLNGIYSTEEFVELRPKQYSYIAENADTAMKAKGLSKDSTRKYLAHQMHIDQVVKDEQYLVRCKTFF
jgi:hypothetical protein